MAKKYTGWAMAFFVDGQITITVVPAKSKKAACEIFEKLELPVTQRKRIYRVCIVKYPGPKDLTVAKWPILKPKE